MESKHKTLLLIDGVINLVLGILLLLFPAGIVKLLGLPYTNTNFYPGILGAVLFGIGIALLIERYGALKNIRGLGLEGAIAINFCGVRIKNPLVAASAEPTLNANNMKKCIDTGAGGVIAKTMTDSPEMRELTTRAKWRFLNQRHEVCHGHCPFNRFP